ncbi:UPF0280 family protein [Chloroflexota bacterium]
MEPRSYRHWVESHELTTFLVSVKETDLYIRATSNLSRRAERLVQKYREMLERYIAHNPAFLISLEPLPEDDKAPLIAQNMMQAGVKAGVGPMAAVAGAMAEYIGAELLKYSPELIIENGGDIFLASAITREIAIYAGDSPLTGKIGLEIDPADTPLGICTSSGTVGHSLSFGKADAVVIVAKSATLADAVATAAANLVKTPEDIQPALDFAASVSGIRGAIIVMGQHAGFWGDIKIKRT